MKPFMWLIAQMLFWSGHIASYVVPIWPDAFYPIYNNLMYWSCILSDKYELGIWTKTDEQ